MPLLYHCGGKKSSAEPRVCPDKNHICPGGIKGLVEGDDSTAGRRVEEQERSTTCEAKQLGATEEAFDLTKIVNGVGRIEEIHRGERRQDATR